MDIVTHDPPAVAFFTVEDRDGQEWGRGPAAFSVNGEETWSASIRVTGPSNPRALQVFFHLREQVWHVKDVLMAFGDVLNVSITMTV